MTLVSSYRAVLAGHAFKSVRSFWFSKLTILFIFLRHRNVFNKKLQERVMGRITFLLENCSDFTFFFFFGFSLHKCGCLVGKGPISVVFINLLGLRIRPYFSGRLKPQVLRPLAHQGRGGGAGAICFGLLVSGTGENSGSVLDSNSAELEPRKLCKPHPLSSRNLWAFTMHVSVQSVPLEAAKS